MTITLSPETQRLLEDRMRVGGFSNADEALRAALQNSDETETDRSPETLASIQRGLADAEAGRSRPWSEFEKEWMAKDSPKAS